MVKKNDWESLQEKNWNRQLSKEKMEFNEIYCNLIEYRSGIELPKCLERCNELPNCKSVAMQGTECWLKTILCPIPVRYNGGYMYEKLTIQGTLKT